MDKSDGTNRSIAAWKGIDLALRLEKWIYRLSAAEIAEIETATDAAVATGKSMIDLTKADFPLPTFTKTLATIRQDLLDGHGFILIRGFPSGGYPVARNATTFWGFGRHLGNPVSQNTRGHLLGLGHVRDVGLVAATNFKVRASQSTERQFFHPDGADVVGLMCLATAKSGGISSLVSSMTVFNEMARRRPDLAERLFQPVVFDRRGEIRDGEGEWYAMPVFNEYEGLLSVSFTGRNIGSASRHPDAPRNPQEAIDLFTSIAEEPDLRLGMALEVGDMQFVHNHTILHHLTSYEDWPNPERKRHLLRLWIAAEGARPHIPPLHQRRNRERAGYAIGGDELEWSGANHLCDLLVGSISARRRACCRASVCRTCRARWATTETAISGTCGVSKGNRRCVRRSIGRS